MGQCCPFPGQVDHLRFNVMSHNICVNENDDTPEIDEEPIPCLGEDGSSSSREGELKRRALTEYISINRS